MRRPACTSSHKQDRPRLVCQIGPVWITWHTTLGRTQTVRASPYGQAGRRALLLSIAIEPRVSAPGQHAALCGAARHDPVRRASRPASGCRPAAPLARDLGVSRTTVIETFDRLTAEGLIECARRLRHLRQCGARLASGRSRPDEGVPSRDASAELSGGSMTAAERFGERCGCLTLPRAFTTALPAFDAFPMAQWARLAAKHWRGAATTLMGYGEPVRPSASAARRSPRTCAPTAASPARPSRSSSSAARSRRFT